MASAKGKNLDSETFKAMIRDALDVTIKDLEAQSQDLLRIE
jgi:hypothetical protein